MARQDATQKEVRFTLPPQVAKLLGAEDEALSKHARERVVLSLYQSGEIGPGLAAEVLGLDARDFIEALGRHGLTLYDYEDGELEREVAGAEEFLRSRAK